MEGDKLPDCEDGRCCTSSCNHDTPECELPGSTCRTLNIYDSSVPEFETLGACVL